MDKNILTEHVKEYCESKGIELPEDKMETLNSIKEISLEELSEVTGGFIKRDSEFEEFIKNHEIVVIDVPKEIELKKI